MTAEQPRPVPGAIDVTPVARVAAVPRGEQSGNAKLTEKAVREIRATYRKGVRGFGTPALAKRFGVNQETIWSIVTRKTWTHV